MAVHTAKRMIQLAGAMDEAAPVPVEVPPPPLPVELELEGGGGMIAFPGIAAPGVPAARRGASDAMGKAMGRGEPAVV